MIKCFALNAIKKAVFDQGPVIEMIYLMNKSYQLDHSNKIYTVIYTDIVLNIWAQMNKSYLLDNSSKIYASYPLGNSSKILTSYPLDNSSKIYASYPVDKCFSCGQSFEQLGPLCKPKQNMVHCNKFQITVWLFSD